MAMHPNFEEDQLSLFTKMVFIDEKDKIIDNLIDLKLIDKDKKNLWLLKYSNEEISQERLINIAISLKLVIDPIISSGGIISSERSKNLISNIVNSTKYFDTQYLGINNITGKVALDFGSGIYNPLAVSIIKYLNGFDKVYSFEPYTIKSDYSYFSIMELILKILQEPKAFNFSGINDQLILDRIAKINLIDIRKKLELFEYGEEEQVSLGPVILIKDMKEIPNNSIDFQSSNAVLEHVDNFEENITILHNKMKKNGVGIHIVDFLDHRHYNNRLLHPYEKYYDGVLEEINGLTPQEMEDVFIKVGFISSKLIAQSVPIEYFDKEKRKIMGKYSNTNLNQLREHLNYYFLRKE